MTDPTAKAPFSPNTRTEFQQHIIENPSNRRVSPSERDQFVQWLTVDVTRPSSQKEFSRRNYVQRSFTWDNTTGDIRTSTGSDDERNRLLVTDDCIVDVVESVHINNQHAGWDATWNDIRQTYYGILRADVIFLLRRCMVCAEDPRKRPKDPTRALCNELGNIGTVPSLFALDDFINENPTV